MFDSFNLTNFYITLLLMQATIFLSLLLGPKGFLLKKSEGGNLTKES